MNRGELVPRRRWPAWFDVRGRHVSGWAFILNRLTGLGLVLYLIIHLWVLRLLTQGEARWNAFIALAKTPPFLVLDTILFFGIIYHALNGIRLTLVGLGIGVSAHKRMFWVLMGIGLVLFVLSTWGLWTMTK